jgi:hypothetical protein
MNSGVRVANNFLAAMCGAQDLSAAPICCARKKSFCGATRAVNGGHQVLLKLEPERITRVYVAELL